MPAAERPKPVHVRRTILCLATIFSWTTHDPDMASGQSSELMEAYNSYNTLYQQGRYAEAEPLFGRSESTNETVFSDRHKNSMVSRFPTQAKSQI